MVARPVRQRSRRLSQETLPRLLPEFPEAFGLLALMLLHDSRRRARVDARGQLILLEEQDRSLWDRDAIVEKALSMGRPGPYQIQAAISSLHLQADRPEEAGDDEEARVDGRHVAQARLDRSTAQHAVRR